MIKWRSRFSNLYCSKTGAHLCDITAALSKGTELKYKKQFKSGKNPELRSYIGKMRVPVFLCIFIGIAANFKDGKALLLFP